MMETARRRVGLIVNPASAAGRGKSVAGHTIRSFEALGYEIILIAESSALATRRAVRQILDAGTVDVLVLVGGDGLLHAVINEKPDIPVGIVPTGSGNDFVRSLDIPHRGVDKAIRRIHASWGNPRSVDLLSVQHRGGVARIAGALSVGYDAVANRIANGIKLRLGPFKYQIAVVLALWRFRPLNIVATNDGHTFTGTKLLFSVTLIPTIGGGIRIVPEARSDEGMFRLFSVDAMPAWRVLTLLPTLVTGRHVNRPEVHIEAGVHIHIDVAPGEKPHVGYGDGEHIGLSPFDVTVLPGALRVLC